MTDEMLLAIPDWKELTDRQLARAVTLAKQRGRQTAELLLARSREREIPDDQSKRIANFDLYLDHCVKRVPNSEAMAREWGNKNAMEACDDPRLSWFCVIYHRVRWKMIGNKTNLKPSLILLQQIRDKQFEEVSRAQYRLSMEVAAIHRQGGSREDPEAQVKIARLQNAFMAHIDYAMLALMTLNIRTEEWMEETSG